MTGAWVVSLSPEATEDYQELDHSVAKLVDLAIEKLSTSPEQRGHALKGNLAGCRALVVGKKKLRVVYEIENDRVLVYVIAIGHRRDNEVYIRASNRLDPKWFE
jgi:mRNA interferase RelE/StbE